MVFALFDWQQILTTDVILDWNKLLIERSCAISRIHEKQYFIDRNGAGRNEKPPREAALTGR